MTVDLTPEEAAEIGVTDIEIGKIVSMDLKPS